MDGRRDAWDLGAFEAASSWSRGVQLQRSEPGRGSPQIPKGVRCVLGLGLQLGNGGISSAPRDG